MNEEDVNASHTDMTTLSLLLVASHPTDYALLTRYVEQQMGLLQGEKQPTIILDELFELTYFVQDEHQAVIGTIEEIKRFICERVLAAHEFEVYRRDGYGCGYYVKLLDGSVQSIREWQSCRGLIATLNEHKPPEPRDDVQAMCAWKLARLLSKDYACALWMTIGFEQCTRELRERGNQVTNQSLEQCSGMQPHVCQMYLDIMEQQKQEVTR